MSANANAKHARAMTMPRSSTISTPTPPLPRPGSRGARPPGHGHGAGSTGPRAAARGAARHAARRGARGRPAGRQFLGSAQPLHGPQGGRTSEHPGGNAHLHRGRAGAACARDQAGAWESPARRRATTALETAPGERSSSRSATRRAARSWRRWRNDSMTCVKMLRGYGRPPERRLRVCAAGLRVL